MILLLLGPANGGDTLSTRNSACGFFLFAASLWVFQMFKLKYLKNVSIIPKKISQQQRHVTIYY